jgi:hypothetical protein
MAKWEERTMQGFIWAFGIAAVLLFLSEMAKGG